MPKLTTIAITTTGEASVTTLLAGFKAYASISDENLDGMLKDLLRQAVLKVQEFADTAIVATKLKLEARAGRIGRILLYQGGGTVESVTELDGTTDVAYTAIGNAAVEVDTLAPLLITYTTTPIVGEVARLTPTVYRYASALYDGAATDELNRILNEVL